MEQYDFSADFDLFFDNLESTLADDQNFKKEYNAICRKAKNIESVNAFDASSYWYMAAVLCYYYYDDADSQENNDRVWAVELGQRAVQNALDQAKDDEYTVMSLIFDLIILKHNKGDVHFLAHELHNIKEQCPQIETLENTLFKTEALKDWFDLAYSDVAFDVLLDWEDDDEQELKIEIAKELVNSPNEVEQEIAFSTLAETLYDMGKYNEAERYAMKGRDMRGNMKEYDESNDYFWGICYTIFALCQEKAGDTAYARTLIERGAKLGIPGCEDELDNME